MTRTLWILALALVAAACTSTIADSTTTVAPPATTTYVAPSSTTVADTTTTAKATPLSTVVTSTTTNSVTTTTFDFLGLLKSITPTGGRTRYNSNQYGCHSDGRCLDDWDTWCDEGEWGWSDDAASELCFETAEDYEWTFDG